VSETDVYFVCQRSSEVLMRALDPAVVGHVAKDG
jgi:hypothetical protein